MTEQSHTKVSPNIPTADAVRSGNKATVTCPTCGLLVTARSVTKAYAEYGAHWTRAVEVEQKVADGEWFQRSQAVERLTELGYTFRADACDFYRSEDDRGRLSWQPVDTDIYPEHKEVGAAFFLHRPYGAGWTPILGPDVMTAAAETIQ